jgi:pimeloyl-ACP methyl ester carboxylesterase
MALTYAIHHPDRLVTAVVDGAFIRRDVERYLADIFAAGCGPYAKLFDIARADNLLPSEDMRAIGERIRILGAMGPMGPLAIVTSNALRPTAETFVSYAAASRSIRLFEGERDARSWLHTQLGSRAGR